MTWPLTKEKTEMATKTRKLRFLRGRCYKGADFGPGQAGGEVADVDDAWADRFIRQGAAEEIPTKDEKAKK